MKTEEQEAFEGGAMTKEQEIIARLLEWAEYMGGFDSQVWRDAEELMSQESVLENEQ